jgi:hypothetical protein
MIEFAMSMNSSCTLLFSLAEVSMYLTPSSLAASWPYSLVTLSDYYVDKYLLIREIDFISNQVTGIW